MEERTAARRAPGVVYTPPVLVRHVLRQTLEARLTAEAALPRLLDPACGEGAFLVEGYRTLLKRFDAEHCDIGRRIEVLRECLFGVDTDHEAVAATWRRLTNIALLDCGGPGDGEHDLAGRELRAVLSKNIQCGDALSKGSIFDGNSFDVIVANPPYIGARQLANGRGRLAESYQGDFGCVEGSCDLYVVFLERICELLAEGGRFGVIVPNRIAVADYARRCRELFLSQTRIDKIEDVSALKAFPAAVYPVILYGAKTAPGPEHRVAICRPQSLETLGDARCWFVVQRDINAGRGFPLVPESDLESRVPTRPLSELATLHSGTTGFAASRVAEALVERDQCDAEAWDFITTGNIDRYCVRKGDVRFLRRAYRRPVLPCDASLLTERKRRLYREAKIVIAGLSLRPEAAWSRGDLALGVQVYAAAEFREDPFYFLGILNSQLFAHLFRTRFVGRRMSGGYLAVTKSQLARLPIRTAGHDPRARRLSEEVSAAASRLTEIMASGSCKNVGVDPETGALEQRIDECVDELYQLRDDEIADVRSELASLVHESERKPRRRRDTEDR